MKLFQPLRDLMPFIVGYDTLQGNGFEAPNAYQKYLCNFTSLLGSVSLGCSTILVGCFLLLAAETFEEISGHFYEFATGLNNTLYFVLMESNCRHIFELNGNYEEIIEKRKHFSHKPKHDNDISD